MSVENPIFGALTLVVLWLLVFPPRWTGVFGRLAGGLLAMAGLAVLSVQWVLGLREVDLGLKQALIAALVVALGWLVSFATNITLAVRDKRHVQLDLLIGLRAEIVIYIEILQPISVSKQAERMDGIIEEHLAEKRAYQPFLTTWSAPVVFDSIGRDLVRLPKRTVEDVVKFYSAFSDLRTFQRDLQSEAFLKMPLDRRRDAYADYFEMIMTATELAERARSRLEVALANLNWVHEKGVSGTEHGRHAH